MSQIQAPPEWKGTFVSTLDALEFMRRLDDEGRPLSVFFGEWDVRRFGAFVDGLWAHLFFCGASNPGWQGFLDWLRIHHGLSSGPWEEKFLADAGGDHHAAIRRFLREAAEFRARTPAGDA
ncbi:hypothetical protein [Anaeromyxobacter oryzae]|uniref:Barstar (barnase inhibitor) domain-containing protein n=1 Tax=Anaeromyxobacter oryzae TaxID=2918170 RepID=A0ABM7WZ28_9BACT|nr:hypothetical protein [Anaeromyxobacter oryzae]BDG04803.1 hypothetical protein AMOR_37990 [Anaeromyxobacter oryzae]